MGKVKLVAELCGNHYGSMDIAKKMIRTAADFCMVDVVKFQKRNVRECLTEEEYNGPHPNPMHAFGNTYGAHREHLEFDIEQHRILKEYAEGFGLKYACSVFDKTSAREIASIDPLYIKIGSGHNLRWDIYDVLFECWQGDIHVSTGATTVNEVFEILKYFADRDPVLYACTSSYPAKVEDLCLRQIEKYRRWCSRVGFSGHHTGVAPDMAAVILGAEYIERHFTLDRASKGTDHAASLEPDGMRKLSKYIKDIEAALKYKEPEVLECEMGLRVKK